MGIDELLPAVLRAKKTSKVFSMGGTALAVASGVARLGLIERILQTCLQHSPLKAEMSMGITYMTSEKQIRRQSHDVKQMYANDTM